LDCDDESSIELTEESRRFYEMVKLLQEYKGFEKGTLHDFGCVRNTNLVNSGIAVWIKVCDVKYQIK
jgi:hypothetical protein